MGVAVEKTSNVQWECLEVRIYFDEDLEEQMQAEFENVLTSWFVLGRNGAFGGMVCDQSEIWREGNVMGFSVDLSRGEQLALDVLIWVVEGFSDVNEVAMNKIVFGTEFVE